MDTRVKSIIKLLTEQTINGKYKWQATGTANEYKLAMDGGTVVINSFLPPSGFLSHSFKLYNEYGVLAVQENCSKMTEDFPDFNALYCAAKDSYTQKDSVIDAILSELK